MQLTYDETIDVLDLKYFSTERKGYSLNPGTYEVNKQYLKTYFTPQCESVYYN